MSKKENAHGGQDRGREDADKSDHVKDHENNDAALSPRATPSFEDAETLVRAGYELIPLRGGEKAPRDAKWVVRPYDFGAEISEARKRGGNLGVRLRTTDLIIDVDPRNGGDKSLDALVADASLELEKYPHVMTGGGGHHYYLRKPADVSTVGKLQKYPGIDFKKHGGQVVAPGAVHPETGRRYVSEFWLLGPDETPEASQALLDLLRVRRLEVPDQVEEADRWGEITPDQLAASLDQLPTDDFGEGSHDDWFQLMCACHHATAGTGREEFIAWSTSTPGYDDHAELIGYRWDSLAANVGKAARPTTIRHLYQVLGRHGIGIPHPAPEEDFEAVEVTSEPLPPGPLGAVADNWVWVADASVFIRRHDLKRYRPEQWRSLFDHLVEGNILSKVWNSRNFVRKFESLTYLPKGIEMPDGERGGRYNIWRPSAIKPTAGDVSWFLEHLDYLVPDQHERDAVLDYLAHLVQRPEVKIHFALVIRGEQGTGKSAIGELMLRIIGANNTTRPSNDELLLQWTGWQEGAQLAILEELMTLGRQEVSNRLKPLITEPTLRIHEKYQTPYTINNHLNLLCFTNHRDALKLEEGDRRWFIVFSPAKVREPAYYKGLFAHLNGCGPANVAHWLLSRDLSSFDAKGHAPATAAKEEMRQLSLGEVEATLLELYREGLSPFDFDLVATEDLLAVIPERLGRQTKNLRTVVKKFLEGTVAAVQHPRNTSPRGTAAWLPKFRLWSIRNHEHWASVGPTKRATAHAEHRGYTKKDYDKRQRETHDFLVSVYEANT
jgi:hypothetical protein